MSVRWNEQQLAEHQSRASSNPVAGRKWPKPKATIRDNGMNKLEAAWADELEAQKQRGEISFWRYSPGGLRLADKTFYHPDFLVVEADGTVRYDETKGFMRDDANVKIKVAASQFPFVFRLIKKKGKTWEITTI